MVLFFMFFFIQYLYKSREKTKMKTQRIFIRLDEKEKEKIKKNAEKYGISISQLMLKTYEKNHENYEKKLEYLHKKDEIYANVLKTLKSARNNENQLLLELRAAKSLMELSHHHIPTQSKNLIQILHEIEQNQVILMELSNILLNFVKETAHNDDN